MQGVGYLESVSNYFVRSAVDVGAKTVNSQFSSSFVSYSLWPHGLKHARLPGLSPPVHQPLELPEAHVH